MNAATSHRMWTDSRTWQLLLVHTHQGLINHTTCMQHAQQTYVNRHHHLTGRYIPQTVSGAYHHNTKCML